MLFIFLVCMYITCLSIVYIEWSIEQSYFIYIYNLYKEIEFMIYIVPIYMT